jgi:hypothetical protein
MIKILQGVIISVNGDRCAEEVRSPFLQHADYCQ